jgi:hypothetical protein
MLTFRKGKRRNNARNGRRRRKQRHMMGCLETSIFRKSRIGAMMISCEPSRGRQAEGRPTEGPSNEEAARPRPMARISKVDEPETRVSG